MADLVERLRAYDAKASLIDRLREHDLSSYPEDGDWQDHYCDRADDLLKEAADRLAVLEENAAELDVIASSAFTTMPDGASISWEELYDAERSTASHLRLHIAALEAEASEGERLRALLADIHRTSPKPFRLDRPGLTHGQAAEIGYGALRDAIQTRVAVALILEAPAREGE